VHRGNRHVDRLFSCPCARAGLATTSAFTRRATRPGPLCSSISPARERAAEATSQVAAGMATAVDQSLSDTRTGSWLWQIPGSGRPRAVRPAVSCRSPVLVLGQRSLEWTTRMGQSAAPRSLTPGDLWTAPAPAGWAEPQSLVVQLRPLAPDGFWSANSAELFGSATLSCIGRSRKVPRRKRTAARLPT